MFEKIEKKFNVIYPENENATYESILNYSLEANNPFQRWYRYKEGFSLTFVKKVINEYAQQDASVILDPFAGSGSTLVAANDMGMSGIGFEVNPFSYFLMKTKEQKYSPKDIEMFCNQYKKIISELSRDCIEKYELPKLSISDKVFQKEAEQYIMSAKTKIDNINNKKVHDLLLLGWLSQIELLSNYRKAGNGLKKRKTVKPYIVNKDTVLNALSKQYEDMYADLLIRKEFVDNRIYNKTSLGFCDELGFDSLDGIIFSPPYANCFDYTEIYKLELWFGDFVKSYDDLKRLRNQTLKSHLNIKYDYQNLNTTKSKLVTETLSKIQQQTLWDKRIPQMIYGYFEDMFNILDNCYDALKINGFCAIVVGNSAYGGVIVPTDLILAEYARSIGFEVDKIEVDRYIITSSQQYEETKSNRKYLRESVVCLKKN